MNIKVDGVVVTYNRLSLLKECLTALLDQEYPLNKIYVINNNSSDETASYLRKISKKYPTIIPVNLKKNVGGAGGFNVGLKFFMKKSNAAYAWIMIQFLLNLHYLTSSIKFRIFLIWDFYVVT